jgi:RimJ/RimL family protein N-acetyltransferase
METYPKEWERHLTMAGGRAVYVRPIRPEDERFYGAFLAAETSEDLRRRFLSPLKDLSPVFISRLTHIDYAKAMAFIALDEATGEMLGVARLHRMAQSDSGEYAIIVRSDVKGHGLGRQLTQMIIAYARSKAFHCIEGQVLSDNIAMLNMCGKFGFVIRSNPEAPYICDVKLSLLD